MQIRVFDICERVAAIGRSRARILFTFAPGVPLRFTPGFMLSPRYAGSNSRNLFRAS